MDMHIPRKTIEECLHVLHTDIVRVWKIRDELGVNTSISCPLPLTEIVRIVPGKQGTEKANDRTCWESI